MKTITRRLERLEERIPRPAPPEGISAAKEIADGLMRIGFARLENESLAETLARFLGITSIELRARLQQRAAGLRC
ncbi:MAG: hypothetical protein ACLP9L_07900 [Thermoguttaceae bacterium]